MILHCLRLIHIQELRYKPEKFTIRFWTHMNIVSASTTHEGTTAKSSQAGAWTIPECDFQNDGGLLCVM